MSPYTSSQFQKQQTVLPQIGDRKPDDETKAATLATLTNKDELLAEFRHTSMVLASLARVNSNGRQILNPTVDIFSQNLPATVSESPIRRVLRDALCILLVQTRENVSMTSVRADHEG
jgi:hypothetical protein